MTDCLRFNAGFDRPNLFFEVRPKSPNPEEMMLEVLDYINSKYRGQTGIIYCMTKRQCEEAADFLRDKGMSADYYHAGMLQTDRRSVQAAWQMGKVQIVCATIGFLIIYILFNYNYIRKH
jgi:bloom syndrome protein